MIVLTAVGLFIGAAVILLTVLNPPPAAQSSAPSPSASGAARTEESVRQAAQTAFDAYASGSSGEFWDLWSKRAQELITREEYVRLFQLCPQIASGMTFTITDVMITGDAALVTATRSGDPTAYDYDFAHESGSWRYVLPPQEEQEYRSRNVDQIVQARQATGTCGAPSAAPAPGGTPPVDLFPGGLSLLNPPSPVGTPPVSTPAPSPPG
ncbi:hypothetical protein HS041_04850 [Planomonospora sp. ID67723]|uniref:hypothetical protein n=1 Tax=Planomonospora sp. ID67723 TaxID=2738134 RepID=UPI0018C3A779|nr:hypothetical protein [Planomonospora sp. ID67723]MBG0827089.1 hypothetical protein [Planomonospora sp. ID67723]